VANRFVEGDLTALDREGSWLAFDPAEPAAAGTGLLGTQRLGLLFQQDAEGALG
jgi:hypothetical protein